MACIPASTPQECIGCCPWARGDDMIKHLRQIAEAHRAFFAAHLEIETIFEAAASVCSHRIPIRGCVFALNSSLEDLTQKLVEGRRRVRGFKVSGNSPYLIEVPFRASDAPPHSDTAKAFLWPNRKDGTACAVGLGEDFDYLWSDLQLYSQEHIAMLYLRTQGFRQAFRRLSEGEPKWRTWVNGFTANVLCDEGQRVKTRREWFPAEKSHDEFFSELEQERQWLRSVEVVVRGPETAHGRVKRDLSFSCQSSFRVFYDTVLDSLRRVAIEGSGMLQERAANDSPTHASRPLQITYETHLFEDKRQNHRLIRVLRQLPDSALSVFHPNPFLHASVVDYSDGSSYTIWITDNAAITLIPGLRATSRSLGRICNHINEHFGEGSIEEVQV